MPLPSPSTAGRRRTRRAGSSPESADVEMPDSARPRAKRRKVNAAAGAKEDVLPMSNQDLVNRVTTNLAMPEHPEQWPAVATQFNNEKIAKECNNVQAYAKISGSVWTYYVKDLEIKIGRPAEPRPYGPGTTPPAQVKVEDIHIDLGPSKLISRMHARIFYNPDSSIWSLEVVGRNGVKIDDETHRKDTTIPLRNGSVIEIGGIQMLFELPEGEPEISAVFAKRAKQLQNVFEDDSMGGTQSNDSSFLDVPGFWSQQTVPASSQQRKAPKKTVTPNKTQATPAPQPYQRGVVLESTAEVDYSPDSMKEVKPQLSYALLIAQAILSDEAEQLTLASIYQRIQDKYAYYRHCNTGWQNSIRHNLSLNKNFRKIPRRTDEPGKGMKWELLPESREDYIEKLRRGKAVGRASSGSPSSPRVYKPTAPPKTPKELPSPPGQGRLEDSNGKELPDPFRTTVKRSCSDTPPSSSSFIIPQIEAFTPDRGPRDHRDPSKVTLLDTPAPFSAFPSAANRRFPPTNNDSLLSPTPQLLRFEPATTITPAPQRQHPRLAPPSASQLPSSYLPTSSPAPFYKFLNLGSTPAKPLDFSPVRSPVREKTQGSGSPQSPIKDELQTSSPPAALENLSAAGSQRFRELGSPLKEKGGGFSFAAIGGAKEEENGEEDGITDIQGIDLTKGFEKIGKFHMNLNSRLGRAASLGGREDGWAATE